MNIYLALCIYNRLFIIFSTQLKSFHIFFFYIAKLVQVSKRHRIVNNIFFIIMPLKFFVAFKILVNYRFPGCGEPIEVSAETWRMLKVILFSIYQLASGATTSTDSEVRVIPVALINPVVAKEQKASFSVVTERVNPRHSSFFLAHRCTMLPAISSTDESAP